MSYVPRRLNPEQAEAARRFMRWVKGKTAAQIRAHYLKGAQSGGTVCAELAMYVAENGRLKARLAAEARRRRIAVKWLALAERMVNDNPANGPGSPDVPGLCHLRTGLGMLRRPLRRKR